AVRPGSVVETAMSCAATVTKPTSGPGLFGGAPLPEQPASANRTGRNDFANVDRIIGKPLRTVSPDRAGGFDLPLSVTREWRRLQSASVDRLGMFRVRRKTWVLCGKLQNR